MTLVREYQPTFVLGDGVTKEFSYLFEEVSENFIKVIVKHDDESTYVPVYSVDLDSHKVIFGDSEPAPLDTDVICIYRETPDLQDTPFRTLQGYDAKALENILTKIVAMIQEIKANGFSTQILQGYPWQLDLLNPIDDSATVVIDYNARILKKGLYFRIQDGNLQVSSDGNGFITMPKSSDILEFRQQHIVYPDLTTEDYLEYRIGNQWFPVSSDFDTRRDLLNHLNDMNNPHQVTKAQVGLGNCDNTADIDKPVIVKVDTMPIASADYVGKEYQYVGETNADYTHSYVYECIATIEDLQTVYSWERVNVQPVVDVVTSTSTTAALSANQGKLLQDQINELKSFGRYLSVWNCATGLAETNPPESPYAYRSGDYFLVGTVDSTTNYKPDGSSYVIGVASTTVETNAVKTNDIYMYDGTTWKLLENVQREIAEGLTNKNTAAGATNPIYDWIGTSAEFAAQNIATTHPDWLCFITDDAAPTMGVYTAAECDALFSRKADTYSKIESNALLANKANTDADNFTSAGTTFLSKLGYMGERYQQLRLLGNGTVYTAPANGWFTLEGVITNAANNRLYLISRSTSDYMAVNKTAAMTFGALAAYRQYVSLPVRKGDPVAVSYESTTSVPDFALRFYYAEGNTEYTPPTYTPVEYIQGTSNAQFVKTNVKPSSNMHIYCKAKITGNSSAFTPLGTRNVTYDGAQFNINAGNQYVVVDWFGGNDSTKRWLFNTTIAQNDVWELEIENSVATLTRNGTVVGTHTFTPTGSVTRELYLTGLNNNGAPGGTGTTGQLYEFKMWDGDGNLVMDMQPAKDESGVACLYNTVMQTLYYNAGTGSYTAGPEINE